MVNFCEQRAITPEGMVQYEQLSILKNTYGTKQCDQVFIKFLSKLFNLERGCRYGGMDGDNIIMAGA